MKSRLFLFCLIILIFYGFLTDGAFCKGDDLDTKLINIERRIIFDGDYARLIDDLTGLLREYPDNPRLYMDLGVSHYGNMEYEKAYEFFKTAQAAGPQGVAAREISCAIAAIEDNRRMLQEIEALNGSLEKEEDGRAPIKEEMAFGHFAVLNNFMEDAGTCPIIAATHLVWLKDNKKEYPGLDMISGEVYYEAGYYQDAEKGFKAALEEDPTDHIALIRLGQTYWKLDARQAATKLFEKAVEDTPDYPLGHFFLGRSYFFQKKDDEAMAELEVFKDSVEGMSEIEEGVVEHYIFALHSLCRKYADIKRFDIMARQYEKIIALRPNDQIAHYNLAVWFLNYYNNPSRALSELEKVIEAGPETPYAASARRFLREIKAEPDTAFIRDFKFVFRKE